MSKLKAWMKANSETDESLGRKVKVSRVQVSRIRRNICRPSLALANKLEKLTGIPAWDLLKAPLKKPAARKAVGQQDAAA